MKINRIITILLFLVNLQCYAQHKNVMISNLNEPNEPAICINQKNTDIIVAGSNIENYYISTNAGLSWKDGLLSSSYGVWGDPCIISDTNGAFYYLHLSNPPSHLGSWIDRIVCQKLENPISEWENGTYTFKKGFKAQDKEWAIVDPSNNNIYVSWTQFDIYGSAESNDSSRILFSRSSNSGATWSDAIQVGKLAGDCLDLDNTVEGATPAVGPNGEVYLAWAGFEKIFFNKSTDMGTSWLDKEVEVADMPGGWDFAIPGISRCNGFPIIACDISGGSYNGNIYINWSDQKNGVDDTDIWLIKSTDNGNSWSNRIKVNDDNTQSHQFFTWMALDQTNGYIYIVFYDRRNYTDKRTDVYMAFSRDGGNTFTNFKISESPFDPISEIFFGDYTNISAHNNVVRPIWTRLDHADLSIWTALIDINLLGVDNEEKKYNEDNEVYPNPFSNTSYISFKLRGPENVTLKVFDMFGKNVATLIDSEYLNLGKYVKHFDASAYNLSSGVYYFNLTIGAKRFVKEIVYIK